MIALAAKGLPKGLKTATEPHIRTPAGPPGRGLDAVKNAVSAAAPSVGRLAAPSVGRLASPLVGRAGEASHSEDVLVFFLAFALFS